MRPTLVLTLGLLAAPLGAQRAPRHPCFGVDIPGRCSVSAILEGWIRGKLGSRSDPAERDRAHAYPVLRSHGFVAAGVAWPVGGGSALGVVAELGGGDSRQGIGVRFDQQLRGPLRLDVTAGRMRVETHEVNVVRRRMTPGPFADATLHVADLVAVQARAERFPGDGGRIRPGRAVYLGARIEGKAGAATSMVALVAAWAAVVVAFFVAGD
jgi:hypothetical protein